MGFCLTCVPPLVPLHNTTAMRSYSETSLPGIWTRHPLHPEGKQYYGQSLLRLLQHQSMLCWDKNAKHCGARRKVSCKHKIFSLCMQTRIGMNRGLHLWCYAQLCSNWWGYSTLTWTTRVCIQVAEFLSVVRDNLRECMHVLRSVAAVGEVLGVLLLLPSLPPWRRSPPDLDIINW